MRLRALQGPGSESQDGHSFRPPRAVFQHPAGDHSLNLAHDLRRQQALPALSLLFRDMSSEPHRAPSLVGWPKPTRDPSRPAAYPGLSCPTTHTKSVDPHDDGESLRRRVPRPGFGYPLRGVHHRPCQHRSVGASLGFTLQGVPLARDRYSFGSPCLPDVTVHPTLPKEGAQSGRLQGFDLAASPCCHRAAKAAQPSIPSWVSPLQSFPPIRPGSRL